jgi:muramidase (phage lysozyme)
VLPNQSAFLDVLAHTEGTERAADPYRVCYANRHVIVDLSQHPYPGEWKGEPLDHLGARYVGKISTAAGRYQINHPTWLLLQEQMALPNFTASCQDDAALGLIKSVGALVLVNAGLITEACHSCRNIWASLPGGDSGQPEDAMQDVLNFYARAGGTSL